MECPPADEAEWWRRLEERGVAVALGGDGGWHKLATWGALRELMEGYGGSSDYVVASVPRLALDTTMPTAWVGELVAAVVEFLNADAGAGDGEPKGQDETQ